MQQLHSHIDKGAAEGKTAGYLPCLGLLIVGKNAFAIRLAASPFQQLACIMSAARGYNVACRASTSTL